MKILIIDDETRARDTIKSMLKISHGLNLDIFEADGLKSGLKMIKEISPDLLLLDIRLKDGSGFELIENIKHKKIPLIFITAYHEYAIKAFKYAALNYLLKPIDPDDLTNAVNQALEKTKHEDLSQKINLLMEKLKNSDSIRKITLKTTDSIHVVPIDNIIFCEADGAYTTFYLTDLRKLLVSKSLGEYESLINDTNFIRTHQSFLVNMQHVLRFDKGLTPSLITIHNHIVPVSSRKKDIVLNFLNQI